MSEKPVLPVTRENLSSGKLAALVAERNDAETQLATDEQLLASRRAVVPMTPIHPTSGSSVMAA